VPGERAVREAGEAAECKCCVTVGRGAGGVPDGPGVQEHEQGGDDNDAVHGEDGVFRGRGVRGGRGGRGRAGGAGAVPAVLGAAADRGDGKGW